MEKRTREILALILLVVLGLSVAFGMGWYIFVGHNWNRAATHIDDLVGSMDGYTVVVFDGVVKERRTNAQSKPASNGSSDSANAAGDSSARSGEPAGESAASSAAATKSDDSVSSTLSKTQSAPSGSDAAENPASSMSQDATGESSASSRFDAEHVAENYREKGAAVVALGKDCMKCFEEPEILFKNGKRIGVFAFPEKYKLSYARFRANIRYLQDHSVDFIIAIVQDKAFLKGRIDGVDMLVLRRDGGIRETGEFRKSTFCIDSPFIGEVQAVIVSPSGVITSRTVREV